jgi:hypothetical protein
MRKDIRVRKQKDGTVELTFAHTDAAKAEATARALMNEMSLSMDKLELVRAPALPSQPVRGAVQPALLGAGIAAGLFAAWLIRRPKRNLGLIGFAAAGAAAAIAGSFMIGNRYTSSAVVRVNLSTEPPTVHFRRRWSKWYSPNLDATSQSGRRTGRVSSRVFRCRLSGRDDPSDLLRMAP